jgi:cation transport protein ChaC
LPRQRFSQPFTPLSDQARRRSLAATLAAAPAAAGSVGLFVYGSLMWDPAVPRDGARPARLSGWHRAMCVWTTLARGTPEQPGLSLGLRPGGRCDGLVLDIPRNDEEGLLASLWQREMWTDIYCPLWVEVDAAGAPSPAITFVCNEHSAQFAGDLAPADAARHISDAVGERGPCRDYLANTLVKLAEMGIEEPALAELLS